MDLHSLRQSADNAQATAQETYPAMQCRTGCNDCCKSHGSPITYAVEWQAIESLLKQDKALEDRVYQRYLHLKAVLRSRLDDESPSFATALFAIPCPFIEAERCSIYAQRPLTCRVFGNAVLKYPLESSAELYTCNPEKDRWERDLPMQQIDLPLRSELFKPLEQSGDSRSLLSFLEAYFYESRGPV